ncbi:MULTISPECIES: DUF421 domain-containing protein [Cytobacillus]|uniref:DUF421 domain-containing protein n=3 Tax=Bacillaceae TaxID=186817 RepID=A0AA46PTF0_CYTFI|nr:MULTISPECIES: DUF421 domain-containing protein [Cytobacillus]KML36381.1 membrane protein [Cytobacillus firmus]MCM3404240.1 DUF421 domain-containing protein [Cytobacillus oceanisediminis]MCM3528287.1 DUF421 domain-containing protein [Cytobacillus oceanisediminis]MCU1804774.1 DUF421 domain-containing protein [Cytobacillus firmus]QOK27659.1 DUF421 domain-containing protein [Cytobacillus oceanisediminis]
MGEVFLGLLTIKVIVGFVTLFFIIIITGRTSISQLTPFHLVFVLVLGDFLGNTIYENKVGIFHFLYAIGLWTLLMLGIEFLTLKNKSTRSLLLGDPNIIIRDGVMDRKLLKKNKLDVNQVLSILRQNQVFSVREVKYGILEANGQISILLQSKYQKPDKQDLSLLESPVYLPTALIIDGEVLRDNLHELGFDQQWLDNQLTTNGYDNVKRILYADWRENEGIHISPF